MEKKKILFLVLASIIFILLASFLILTFVKNNEKDLIKRKNLIKLINRYIETEEYERALDKVEELLLQNPDDQEILDLQDTIIEAKNEKKRSKDLERDQFLDSMSTMLERSNESPIIIRTNNQEDSHLSKKEREKQSKINKLIEDGIDEYNNQNYAKAKNNFLKALDIDNRNAEANALLGATLYDENPKNKKNVEEAIKRIKKALKQNHNLESAHYTLARIYNDQGLSDLAIEEYNETLKLNPNKYEAFYALGKIYYNREDYKSAEINFYNAVKIKTDYVNGFFYLAQTKRRLNKLSGAKKYYKKVISLDPNVYLAYYSLGEVYRIGDDYFNAIIYYKRAIDLNSKYNYHQKIGECYKKTNQSNKAIESFLKAISLNPGSSENDKILIIEAYENLAEIEKNRGKYNEALKYIEKGLTIDNQSSLLYYISAFSKNKLGNEAEAINDYLLAIKINPKDIESYINLSKLYNETGRFNKTIIIAQKGLSIDNTQYKLYNNLGDSLQKTNNCKQAITAYKKSVNINRADSDIYYNLGICYKELDDKENSIKSFQRAISINDNYYEAYYELGTIYFSQEKYKEAKSIFNILLNKNPNYPKREQIDKMLSLIGN